MNDADPAFGPADPSHASLSRPNGFNRGESGLKPCPFCGSEDVELRESITDAMVACCNCGSRTGLVYLGASDESNAFRLREVAGVWNARALAMSATNPVEGDAVETIVDILAVNYEAPARHDWNVAEKIVAALAMSAAKPVEGDAVLEAITEHWGERCPDFDANCCCCQAWQQFDALARPQPGNPTVEDEEDTYELGKLEGRSEAVQQIDELTGGDGEYRYCTNHDPERHCPDPEAMIARIVARFKPQPGNPGDDIERAAQHVLATSRKGTASLNDEQRDADNTKMLSAYRDIIGKALRFLGRPQPGNDEVIERVKVDLAYADDVKDRLVEVLTDDLRHLLTLAKPSPQADGERERAMLSNAFEAGALAVHQEWRAHGELDRTDEPDFAEAANDYAIAALNPVPSSGEGGEK